MQNVWYFFVVRGFVLNLYEMSDEKYFKIICHINDLLLGVFVVSEK